MGDSPGIPSLADELIYVTRIQSKILVTLFRFGLQYVNNENFLKASGIAQSTWSEEQLRLLELGLLEKKSFRVMTGSNVFRTVAFRLSGCGREVAFNLLNISRILDRSETNAFQIFGKSEPIGKIGVVEGKEIEKILLEAVEVALEGFGRDLLDLAKATIEVERNTTWENVVGVPDQLVEVLREICGRDGSEVVEAMICQNVRSLFGIDVIESHSLSSLINEVKQKANLGNKEPVSSANIEVRAPG